MKTIFVLIAALLIQTTAFAQGGSDTQHGPQASTTQASQAIIVPESTNIYEWKNSCPDMDHLGLYFKDRTWENAQTKVLRSLRCGPILFYYVNLGGTLGMVNANDVIIR